MTRLRYKDVFKPGAYPEKTYITRRNQYSKLSYEDRLRKALDTDGFLISITGPSKTGKTVLCEGVIGLDSMVEVNGNDLEKHDNFWDAVAAQAGISLGGVTSNFTTTNSGSGTSNAGLTQTYTLNKKLIIDHFVEYKKVLILDDFHYASEDKQYEVACQLKDVIRKGFKAVVISLPHRSDDPVRQNPDLKGRILGIELHPWTEDELIQIADVGFKQLEVDVPAKLMRNMAKESACSPQLMQYICLNLEDACSVIGTTSITQEVLNLSCELTTENLMTCEPILEFLKAGPPRRGQARTIYKLSNGCSADLYGLLLHIIAQNPPYVKLSLDEIKRRSDALVIGVESAAGVPNKTGKTSSKPSVGRLKEALNKTQMKLVKEKEFYVVIEWKDGQLHILDPLFLFYLRWSNWKERLAHS